MKYQIMHSLVMRLKEIDESITPLGIMEADGEKSIYGRAEEMFNNYLKDNYAVGKTELSYADYLNHIGQDLDAIGNELKSLEKAYPNFTIHTPYAMVVKIKQKIKALLLIEEKNNLKEIRASRKLKTYRWNSSGAKLSSLYNHLIKFKYILKATSFEDFKLIFENISTDKIKNPIIWKSGNATELLYFIILLKDEELITSKSKQMSYDTLRACFAQ